MPYPMTPTSALAVTWPGIVICIGVIAAILLSEKIRKDENQ